MVLQRPSFTKYEEVRAGINRSVRSLAWSCDGKWVAVGMDAGEIKVYESRSTVSRGVYGPDGSLNRRDLYLWRKNILHTFVSEHNGPQEGNVLMHSDNGILARRPRHIGIGL